jgi:hypothetical protein
VRACVRQPCMHGCRAGAGRDALGGKPHRGDEAGVRNVCPVARLPRTDSRAGFPGTSALAALIRWAFMAQRVRILAASILVTFQLACCNRRKSERQPLGSIPRLLAGLRGSRSAAESAIYRLDPTCRAPESPNRTASCQGRKETVRLLVARERVGTPETGLQSVILARYPVQGAPRFAPEARGWVNRANRLAVIPCTAVTLAPHGFAQQRWWTGGHRARDDGRCPRSSERSTRRSQSGT